MRIIFTVTDKDTLAEYKDAHKDIIIADFTENIEGWLPLCRATVEKGEGRQG